MPQPTAPCLILYLLKRSLNLKNTSKEAYHTNAFTYRKGRYTPTLGQQRLRASTHIPTFTPQRSSSKFIGTICVAILGFGFYRLRSQATIALESDDRFEGHLSHDIKDLTGWVPYTMEDVEEYLRIREAILEPRSDSGVLRVDLTQLESNNPLEDTVSYLNHVIDSKGKTWLTLGVFDGHW